MAGGPRFVDDLASADTGDPDGLRPPLDIGAHEFSGGPAVLADVKPGSCPNAFNRASHGVLPVALVGSAGFDPGMVDASTLLLSRADGVGGSVSPNEGPAGPQTELEDVATAFDGEPCDCHGLAKDGIPDLVMHFRSDDVVADLALDALSSGALVELVVTGNLLDATPFTARDCIRLVPPGPSLGSLTVESNADRAWIGIAPLDETLDGGGFAAFERRYPMTSVVTVTASPRAGNMRFVRWVVDGVDCPLGREKLELVVAGDHVLQAVYGAHVQRR